MKNELIFQYGRLWKVFIKIIESFDDDAWIHTGRKSYVPARIAFHILKSVKYYLADTAAIPLASGKSFESNWETTSVEDLPSQKDILHAISVLKARTENWLLEKDLSSKNTAFDWAGETKLGVTLFSLQHALYHLGELSSLLNESRNGNAEDIYANV